MPKKSMDRQFWGSMLPWFRALQLGQHRVPAGGSQLLPPRCPLKPQALETWSLVK